LLAGTFERLAKIINNMKKHLIIFALQLVVPFVLNILNNGNKNGLIIYFAISLVLFILLGSSFIKNYKEYKRKWLGFIILFLSAGITAFYYYFWEIFKDFKIVIRI
jgi:hypothetical protein